MLHFARWRVHLEQKGFDVLAYSTEEYINKSAIFKKNIHKSLDFPIFYASVFFRLLSTLDVKSKEKILKQQPKTTLKFGFDLNGSRSLLKQTTVSLMFKYAFLHVLKCTVLIFSIYFEQQRRVAKS